jgi:hypothetical protein
MRKFTYKNKDFQIEKVKEDAYTVTYIITCVSPKVEDEGGYHAKTGNWIEEMKDKTEYPRRSFLSRILGIDPEDIGHPEPVDTGKASFLVFK